MAKLSSDLMATLLAGIIFFEGHCNKEGKGINKRSWKGKKPNQIRKELQRKSHLSKVCGKYQCCLCGEVLDQL